jgi:hypothetical protein
MGKNHIQNLTYILAVLGLVLISEMCLVMKLVLNCLRLRLIRIFHVCFVIFAKLHVTLLLTTASRTALGPTQPPIQWVLGALSLVKRPGREADHSLASSAEVKE